MNEFNNRIAVQRYILQLVNLRFDGKEELLSLSSKAIERWALANSISTNAPVLDLIRSASGRLLFLANKSQEQVSEEYTAKALEIDRIAEEIERVLGA